MKLVKTPKEFVWKRRLQYTRFGTWQHTSIYCKNYQCKRHISVQRELKRCYVASAARSFLNANVPDAWPDFDAGSGPAGVGKAVNLMCVPYGGVVDRHVVDSLLLCTPGCGSCYGDNESSGGGGGARLNFDRGGNSKAWNTFGARDGVDEREAQTDMRVDLRARGWPIST